MQKYIFIVASLFLFLTCNKAGEGTLFLIIYSSGQSFKTISEITPEEVDVVTTPTPAENNMEQIASEMKEQLIVRGYQAQKIRASEVKSHTQLLEADYLIFASPAYFWNISGEMKSMIDVHLGRIYISEKASFGQKKIGVCSLAEVAGSAKRANESFSWAISDCNNRVRAEAIFLTSDKQADIKEKIKLFIDSLL